MRRTKGTQSKPVQKERTTGRTKREDLSVCICAARTGSAAGERRPESMQITDVRVRKVAKEGKLKAVVSITIDDEFVVHDIKVIEGEKGLFIAMPSKKAVDGEYRDIAHPINSGTRERIQTTILNKYEESLEEEEPITVDEM